MISLHWLVAVVIGLGTAGGAYHPVGLGTLGGQFSQAAAINERGDVVGASATGQHTHAFLWRDGRMTDLGTLGGRHSAATDINNRGEIVGFSETADGVRHAFLWRDGRMTDLGTLGDPGAASMATAINDKGDIVGDNDGPGGLRAFLWRDGRMTALDSGPSRAADINNHGHVVGTSYAGEVITAVLWRDGHAVRLGGGYGTAINNRGQVLFGDSSLWDHGRVTRIEPPAGASTVIAAGLNDHGTVVGSTDIGALRWRRGHATTLPGDAFAAAADVSDRGQIVGFSGTEEGRQQAVLWTR